MFVLRVFFYFLFFAIAPISNELTYDLANEDEKNDLLSEEYDYNAPNAEQDDLNNMYSNLLPDSSNLPSKITEIIGSIRENSVDILQDIGDLEDILKEQANVTTTTPKAAAKISNSTGTGKLAVVQVQPKTNSSIDVLEDGKAKLRIWDEQIKTCKKILEQSKIPRADGGKPILTNNEEIQLQQVIVEDKKQSDEQKDKMNEDKTPKLVITLKKKKKHNEEKDTAKLRRRRRRLQESMENFRQVYS